MTRSEPGASASAQVGALPALRFLTCGSVDDGKSTLIGRLLHEQNQIFDDQRAALERDTRRHGTTGAALYFALLVDGLEAERQQGITIDVAYRYFRTARRAFVVADTPGHEQYTRNMATGASNADLAVLLVDARKGLLRQTHRHATIVALLGLKHVVLAVNKIDLVAYRQDTFEAIVAAFRTFAATLGFGNVTAIPMSAREGDNLSTRSPRTPWFAGPTLLEHLETVDIAEGRAAQPLRLPVQWVNRPDLDFRGVVGTLASGRLAAGDEIAVAGSPRTSRVARIVTADGDRAFAEAGDAVTLVFADERDVSRGDVLCAPRARPSFGRAFAADLIWMAEDPLRLGRSYLLKLAARTVPATVDSLDYRLDIDSLAEEPATTLQLNEVGRAALATTADIAFDRFADDAATGAFILIDRESNATVAAGTIQAVRHAPGQRNGGAVTRLDRARLKHQRPAVVWFTGRSGFAALAAGLESRLHRAGVHTALLDDATFQDRRDLDPAPAARRGAEMARAMTDAGLVVLCAFEAHGPDERAAARAAVRSGEFVEVFVDEPSGTVGARSEPPSNAEVVVDGAAADRAVEAIHAHLAAAGFVERFDDLADWSI